MGSAVDGDPREVGQPEMEKVCEAQPHCACLAPAGDGLEEYQCECVDDGTWMCRSCRAPLVQVSTYEKNRQVEMAAVKEVTTVAEKGTTEGEMMTLDETKPHVAFRCPCGGTATAGEAVENGHGFVLHSLPPCESYLQKEVTDYLQWAREHGARTLS